MIILAVSAAFVGIVHSLSPGHWLPVVLMAKTRKWSIQTAITGALVTASGHIFLSTLLGLASVFIGVHFLSQYENQIERYSGLLLALFGLTYGGYAYFRHSKCHGHTHHGPSLNNKKAPFLFLFSLGFSPCIAILPVFATAASEGSFTTILAFISFSLGVLFSFIGATLLVSMGLVKLDHPLLEHYADVITGGGIAVTGLLLFCIS